MLFNGKYYNKPGHLGMTRQQLKEALNKAQTSDQFIIPESANITLTGDDLSSLISTGTLSDIAVTGISEDYIPKSITVLLFNSKGIANISAVTASLVYDFMYYIDALNKTAYIFAVINLSDPTKAELFLHILD